MHSACLTLAARRLHNRQAICEIDFEEYKTISKDNLHKHLDKQLASL